MNRARRYAFLDTPGPAAFAHRGGGLEAEENTMPAFERAAAMGFTHAELDVHLTRDGEVVIHHDDSLSRMFGVDRAVAGLSMADLAGIATPGGAVVPKLAELLHALPQMKLAIELKSDAVAAPLAEVLRRADALDRVAVGSFSPLRTLQVRRLLGEDLCWSPAHRGVAQLWASGFGLPLRLGFPVVQVPQVWKGVPIVTPRTIRAAHRRGLKVQVWTVDNPAEMHRLLDMGVDGIMTDRPAVLREVMLARGQWG